MGTDRKASECPKPVDSNEFAVTRRPVETWNPADENRSAQEKFAIFPTCATFSGN
jgi:hypothetical protein